MAYTTIDDPSEYFHTRLFQGDGSSGLTVTNNAMFDISFYGKTNGDFMVTGYVISADAPAFSDQD